MTQPLWFRRVSEHSAPWVRAQQVGGCASYMGGSIYSSTQTLKQTKPCSSASPPTLPNRTGHNEENSSECCFLEPVTDFFFYYLEAGLILLFLSSNMWIIFSPKLGRIWQPHIDSGNVRMSLKGSVFCCFVFLLVCSVAVSVLFCVLALIIHSLPKGYWIFKCIWNSTTEVGSSI